MDKPKVRRKCFTQIAFGVTNGFRLGFFGNLKDDANGLEAESDNELRLLRSYGIMVGAIFNLF